MDEGGRKERMEDGGKGVKNEVGKQNEERKDKRRELKEDGERNNNRIV